MRSFASKTCPRTGTPCPHPTICGLGKAALKIAIAASVSGLVGLLLVIVFLNV